MCPFIWQWLHVRVSFFLPLSSFSFEGSFPLCLLFLSTLDKVVSSSPSAFSSPFSFPPSIRHCFYISSTMCFAVHVTFSLFLHIWVTVITVPYFFPKRRISCATFFPLLTGTPYFTSHNAISSNSFRGFFLFINLSLLNASSSSVSDRIEIALKFQPQFHTLPLGKFLSAFVCRLTLLRRLIDEKAWMNWHIAFLFMSTASFWFFSSSTVMSNGQFSLLGSLVSIVGSKHASNPFSIRCADIFISQMAQSSPWLPLKTGIFEVVPVTTSTLCWSSSLHLLVLRPPFLIVFNNFFDSFVRSDAP